MIIDCYGKYEFDRFEKNLRITFMSDYCLQVLPVVRIQQVVELVHQAELLHLEFNHQNINVFIVQQIFEVSE